jgi:hypothetical protein
MKKGGNPQNLTPFKKGQSGNPNGRPKKLPAIDKIMADVLGSLDDDNSPAHEIIEAIKKKAKLGDPRAAELLLDRAYGKVKQSIEHLGDISIHFDKEDAKL